MDRGLLRVAHFRPTSSESKIKISLVDPLPNFPAGLYSFITGEYECVCLAPDHVEVVCSL